MQIVDCQTKGVRHWQLSQDLKSNLLLERGDERLSEMDFATLFGPKRIKARAIDRDQIHADFHQGARRQSRISDAVYIAAADQMQNPNNPLALQEPSLHGPRNPAARQRTDC